MSQSNKEQFELLKEDYLRRISYAKMIFESRNNLLEFLKWLALITIMALLCGFLLSVGESWKLGLKKAFVIFGLVFGYNILLKPIWSRLIRNNKTI